MAGPGGARPGAGAKPGVKKAMTDLARAEAKLNGILPHEWLLNVVRGEPIEQMYLQDVIDEHGVIIGQEVKTMMVYPPLDMRVDAAKAVAPYYAPRLATQVITLRGREDMLNSMTDEQIEATIKELSASIKTKKPNASNNVGLS